MRGIGDLHGRLVDDLIACVPESERARELRAMIRRLEEIDPGLEVKRIEAMKKKLRGAENLGDKNDHGTNEHGDAGAVRERDC